jgi:hypothetical protein
MAFGQESSGEGRVLKRDLVFGLGGGFGAHGTGFGYGVALVPGAEWIMTDWRTAETLPTALGVAAAGFIELIPGTGLGLGADALVVLHMGFPRSNGSVFFQNLDVYAAMGGGVVYVGDAAIPFGLIFPTVSLGFAWYFRENLAVYLEGVYRNGWRAVGYGGAVIGIRMKRPPE